MSAIAKIIGRAVFDSNGKPAIEAEVVLADGARGRALAPRGSTTGEHEAIVLEESAKLPALAAAAVAVDVIRVRVQPALTGIDGTDQGAVDAALLAIDPSPRKEALGGNVSIAVSMAAAKAGAASARLPLHRHLSGGEGENVPGPMFNIIDGATTPESAVTGIEFLLIPSRDLPPGTAMEMGVRVYGEARRALRGRRIAVGDSAQGAVEAELRDCEEGFDVVLAAADRSGFRAGVDFTLGVDLAAADYCDHGRYTFPWCTPQEQQWDRLLERYERWQRAYPLTYLEDAFGESDIPAWVELTRRAAATTEIIGDDLFASSPVRIAAGIEGRWAHGVLIKPNQIGTVTETLRSMRIAAQAGFATMVSQRSGENDDAFITHLAIAGGARLLKAGGMSRMDRIIKYNELLRLAENA